MPFKVFYAWQSDRPNNVCRGLIRKALDKAAIRLNAALSIEEADRSVEIDQDTQGVPGSPAVAETILEKIRSCDAFVPDLTIISAGDGGRRTPNPNVLIEYGYALHALGDQRIIGVFNESFGAPKDLPFDLRHKIWPIRYEAADDGDADDAQAQRRIARDQLASALAGRIEDVIRSFAQDGNSETATLIHKGTAAEPGRADVPAVHQEPAELSQTPTPLPGVAQQFPWDGGFVGYRAGRQPDDLGYEVRLLDGPTLFLQLKSRMARNRLTNVDTLRIVTEAVRPLPYQRSSGRDTALGRHGVASFTTLPNDPGTAVAASLLVPNGELYGVDRYHLQVARFMDEAEAPYIPTAAVEEILIDGLVNFLDVAQNHLALRPPLDIVAGLEGIAGYRLAVDPRQFDNDKYVGPILCNRVDCKRR